MQFAYVGKRMYVLRQRVVLPDAADALAVLPTRASRPPAGG
jgi:hypothetical protein